MFLRAACIRWFPPIDVASPSPVTTITSCFEFAIFSPVANAMARPCVVCNESHFTYPGILEEQPIPDTILIFSKSISDISIALNNVLKIIPFPQPGQNR